MISEVIGFLGPTGSFSEAAYHALFPEPNINRSFFMANSLELLIQALSAKQITHALLPFRNSKEDGELLKNRIDGAEFIKSIITSDPPLYIIGEKLLPLEFCLLGSPEGDLSKITTILSNPYAEKLCKEYLEKVNESRKNQDIPPWKIQICDSSSKAAAEVNYRKNYQLAALASKQAAKIYCLKILDHLFPDISKAPIMHFILLSYKGLQDRMLSTETASTFTLTTKDVATLKLNLKSKNYKVYYFYQSVDIPHTFLLDVFGNISIEKLAQDLNFDSIRKIGTYPIDPNRNIYQTNFNKPF